MAARACCARSDRVEVAVEVEVDLPLAPPVTCRPGAAALMPASAVSTARTSHHRPRRPAPAPSPPRWSWCLAVAGVGRRYRRHHTLAVWAGRAGAQGPVPHLCPCRGRRGSTPPRRGPSSRRSPAMSGLAVSRRDVTGQSQSGRVSFIQAGMESILAVAGFPARRALFPVATSSFALVVDP